MARVVVDRGRCQGHGLCVVAAPEVFDVDDSDLAHVLVEQLTEEQLGQAKAAQAGCPENAIKIEA